MDTGASLCVRENDNFVTESCGDFFQSLSSRFTIDIFDLVPTAFCACSSYVIHCLREVEISNNKEEEAAAHEDVVIVLFNIGKCAGTCLGDCNMLNDWSIACVALTMTDRHSCQLTSHIDDKVRCGSKPHDLASQGNG